MLRRVTTGGNEKAARVSGTMDYRIGEIKFYVCVNNKKQYVTYAMSCMRVYMPFVCGIEIEN